MIANMTNLMTMTRFIAKGVPSNAKTGGKKSSSDGV